MDSLKQPTGNGKQKISAPSAPVPKLNLDDVAQSGDSVKPQDTLKSTLKSMALERSKITARMAQLEFDLVMGAADNGDTELLSELKYKLVKISELEKRYSPGGDVLSLVNGPQTVSMNSGTARTAVETPSVQPRLFENGAPDVFIERNSNPIHQILDFSNLGADTTFNSAPGTKLKLQMPRMNSMFEKSPEIFMNVLERRLVVDNIDRTHWVTYLGAALEGTQQRIWFAKFVEFSSIQYTWEEIKRLVIEKFSPKDRKQISIQKLNTIRQGADEPAEKYVDRFIELMFDAGLDDNDQNALFAFGRGVKSSYKKLYNSMCPVWNVGTLARAYQLLKTLDDSDVDSGIALHCSNCGRNNHSTSHCRDLQRSSGMNKPFHNKHIQHRPFSGNQKYQNKPPAPTGDVKNALGERMLTKRPASDNTFTCYRCGEQGHTMKLSQESQNVQLGESGDAG